MPARLFRLAAPRCLARRLIAVNERLSFTNWKHGDANEAIGRKHEPFRVHLPLRFSSSSFSSSSSSSCSYTIQRRKALYLSNICVLRSNQLFLSSIEKSTWNEWFGLTKPQWESPAWKMKQAETLNWHEQRSEYNENTSAFFLVWNLIVWKSNILKPLRLVNMLNKHKPVIHLWKTSFTDTVIHKQWPLDIWKIHQRDQYVSSRFSCFLRIRL